MMQQGMMFNTFASVPLENTSNQTAPSDPTGDQLQRCMDSVQELAKTIARAMEIWHGRGLLGTLDIRECHGKMSENLKRLPASERCPYCGHLLYWAKTRDTSNRGSLEICNCHATVKRYKSPSRQIKMQKRLADSDIDVDSKSPDSADELDEDYSEADIKKPKKDGKKRPCQDYRYLNSWITKNAYPVLLISDLMTKLKGAQYFTKFDVLKG